MANVFHPEWQFETNEPPFLNRVARVGDQAGAERLGASVYEIEPGGRASPLHVHHANEELIIVLAGSPILRTADESRQLAPGEVVACLPGRRGAHTLHNATEDSVRVLIVSTMIYPEICEQLDSGKVLVLTAPPRRAGDDDLLLAFRRDDSVDPAEREVTPEQ